MPDKPDKLGDSNWQENLRLGTWEAKPDLTKPKQRQIIWAKNRLKIDPRITRQQNIKRSQDKKRDAHLLVPNESSSEDEKPTFPFVLKAGQGH